jgi:hypothetical protein
VEHRGPISSLAGTRVAVWWPGDGDEAAVEEKLDSISAQALGEGGEWVECGENQWRYGGEFPIMR